jgi:protein involved in polysaccharide export with SLBB domain/cytochrome c-type biogenesis protein CcmH/NrfG
LIRKMERRAHITYLPVVGAVLLAFSLSPAGAQTAVGAQGRERVVSPARDHPQETEERAKATDRARGRAYMFYYQIGTRYALAGRYAEALSAFKRALLLNPKDGDIYFSLGNVYSGLGQWADAVEAYKEAIRLSGDDGEAHNNLGVAYLNLGALTQAVASFERAARLYPAWAEPHFNLGRAYSRMGRRDEAEAAYRRAVRLRPDLAARISQTEPSAPPNVSPRTNRAQPPDQPVAARPKEEETTVKQKAEPSDLALAHRVGETPASDAARARQINASGGTSRPPEPPPGTETKPAIEKPAIELLAETKASSPESATSTREGASSGDPSTRGTNLTVLPPAVSVTTEPGASSNASPEKEAQPAAPAPVPVKRSAPPATGGPNAAGAVDPSSIYRVGPGDMLEVRVLNAPARGPTRFRVTAGGLLEYGPAGAPLRVAGLTVDEIKEKLAARLERRMARKDPEVVVGVREYASHHIIVGGLVNDPGTRIIQREAVPLYAVIADAQPRPEAGQAVISSRATGRRTTVDLADSAAMNTLVHAGDVVTVERRARRFIYIGGRVAAPGEKEFHPGMTLTQAILAAGGALSDTSVVKIIRPDADGRLTTVSYDLKEILLGQIPDPPLQAGDRITVTQ